MVFTSSIRIAAARRIPMIRFRKGGHDYPSETAASMSSSGAGGAPESPLRTTAPAIEDWQLPPRYRRKPMDQKEMDYINRGGPE